MKAIKLILASALLLGGLNATANVKSDDCSQLSAGTREDAYTNANQARSRVAGALAMAPRPVLKPTGTKSAVSQ